MTSSLEGFLKERIIGQDEVIDEISSVVKRGANGFHYEDVPKARILSLGPTGVGKTEVVLLTCDYLFRDKVDLPRQKRLARFDMSEYNTDNSIHKLLGSADQISIFEMLYDQTGGTGVLLWDEIEKAHTLILDTLLQVLSAGRVTLATGRVLDLRDYTVFCTTNIGGKMLMDSQTTRRDKIQSRVENALQDVMRPEIIGRFELLATFNKVGDDSTYAIADIHAQECVRIAAKQGHDIVLSHRAVDAIRRSGYSEKFGARPIRDEAMRIIGDAVLEKESTIQGKVTGTLVYDAQKEKFRIE